MVFIFFTCLSFLGFIVGFSATQIWASNLQQPIITISEIMSCPLTGQKEWVELERTADTHQLPLTEPVSLAHYTLQDDKSVIWTGSEATENTFAPNAFLSVIELTKQYLNNSGDTLSLYSPEGLLLDTATIPACQAGDTSWTFQDGDWTASSPTPGAANPTPTPTPTPSPNPLPTHTPSPSPSPSASPTTTAFPIASPTANPAPTASPQSKQEIQTHAVNGDSDVTTIPNDLLQAQSLVSQEPHAFLNPRYLSQVNARISLGADSASSSAQVASSNQEKSGPTILGSSDELPKSFQKDMLYSPERSLMPYLSAILGGVLFSSSGGLCTLKIQKSSIHENTQTP